MNQARLSMCFLIVLLLHTLYAIPASAADNNLLAYSLYQQGEYAKAGEIFSDPAWKGLALYRSSQWWRAAEAFVRANDPLSAYNLGNCYVQLGYYALALDAYQRALSLDPTLNDAKHNADIMRKLLSNEKREQQRGGRQPSGEVIDRLESASPDAQSGDSGTGDQNTSSADKTSGKSDDANEQSDIAAQQAQAGNGSESSQDTSTREPPEGEGGGAVDGKASDDPNDTGRPSGGAESDTASTNSAAAGIRSSLEHKQATAQWLNRIQHDPQLYLQRRLKLEQKRRRAAGQSPPQGGSAW